MKELDQLNNESSVYSLKDNYNTFGVAILLWSSLKVLSLIIEKLIIDVGLSFGIDFSLIYWFATVTSFLLPLLFVFLLFFRFVKNIKFKKKALVVWLLLVFIFLGGYWLYISYEKYLFEDSVKYSTSKFEFRKYKLENVNANNISFASNFLQYLGLYVLIACKTKLLARE